MPAPRSRLVRSSPSGSAGGPSLEPGSAPAPIDASRGHRTPAGTWPVCWQATAPWRPFSRAHRPRTASGSDAQVHHERGAAEEAARLTRSGVGATGRNAPAPAGARWAPPRCTKWPASASPSGARAAADPWRGAGSRRFAQHRVCMPMAEAVAVVPGVGLPAAPGGEAGWPSRRRAPGSATAQRPPALWCTSGNGAS